MSTEVSHPVFARLYRRISETADKRGGAEHRSRLLTGLRGRVIEVGAGNGRNFARYPATVEEVVAVEPEPHLRKVATRAASRVPVNVRVIPGVADELPAADGSFDAAVASLVLCTVPDQSVALAEIHRVLKPGGELRFYEHVVAENRIGRGLMRLADATIWPHVAGGCHASRDTAAAIAAAGFTIERNERFRFAPGPGPAVPYIIGVARRA